MMLYKVLNEDGTPCNGGKGKWYLPKNGKVGRWMPAIKTKLIPCERGYHLCEVSDLTEWLGPTIWEAEFRGDSIRDTNKTVVRQARLLRKLDTWNEKTARLFACDCAEHVLALFEKHYPTDKRPRQAIDTARKFANGEATQEEMKDARAAAWNAAWNAGAAARDAAGAAARDAAVDTAGDARAAAWNAGAAVWAARDAAVAAVRAAERKWQTERLMFYLNGEKEEGR